MPDTRTSSVSSSTAARVADLSSIAWPCGRVTRHQRSWRSISTATPSSSLTSRAAACSSTSIRARTGAELPGHDLATWGDAPSELIEHGDEVVPSQVSTTIPSSSSSRARTSDAVNDRCVGSGTMSHGPLSCVPLMSTKATTLPPSTTVQRTSNRRSENPPSKDRNVPAIRGLVVNRGIASASRPLITVSKRSTTRARRSSFVTGSSLARHLGECSEVTPPLRESE